MSLINRVFASVGVGSAKVDTKLENDKIVAGDTINGVVEVKGGSVEQQIDDIYLTLMTSYIREYDDKKVEDEAVIGKYRLTKSFTIKPNETKEVPFSFELPLDVPVTLGRTKVWVQTGLDIKKAIDPSDRDYIEVYPYALMNSVLNAITDLGFRLREVECEQAPKNIKRRLPFVQEFEFVPTKGEFSGKLDELEVIFLASFERHLEMYFQVDRKANGLGGLLAEALDLDEKMVRLSVSKNDGPVLKQKIRDLIQNNS